MPKLFIIDLMPFLYKGHFVFLRSPRITSGGMNTSALMGFANGVQAILRKEKPEYAVLAMDPGGPTFRHESYPPYKAQRQKMPEDLAANIPYAFELAEALKIPVVRVDGFEADDVMGTLAVKGVEAGFDVYMATPDKDAAQLVRPGVRLYRPPHAGGEATIYDEAGVIEHWGLASPSQMIDFLALAGDSSDNIPGIKGVGEKTALGLLKDYHSVEGIIANAAKLKGKLAEKVAAGAEDAKISKFLATIRTDVPVEPDWEAYRRNGVDEEKLKAVCAKFELSRLAKEFGIAPSSLQAPAPRDAATTEEEMPIAVKTLADTPHDYRLVTTEDEARALLQELQACDLIAFDTETAASEGHSSTEAHFCKLVGFSFAAKPGKAWYVDGSLVDIFRPLFADPAKTFTGHNVKFDRSVLLRYGIGFGGAVHDTMLAHYCLDASLRHGMDFVSERHLAYRPIPITALIGEKERGKEQLSMAALKPAEILDYAAEDADVALRLEAALRPEVEKAGAMKALAEVEEPLVKILIDMEREGVRLDTAALKEYGLELDKAILELTIAIKSYAGVGFNPDSPRQLGELLFGKLGLDTGASKKTSTGAYSTDEKTLSRLLGSHPIIQNILDYRACSKLKSTYVDKLPQLIDEDGRVHTTYSQAFTETGRLSSSDPNLQNIPIRTERGRMIRKAFIPRDGNVLVSADYSQIELRLMAAFSGDDAMKEAFARGEDIHRDTAARVYGLMPEFVTAEQRSKCKMVNFGIIYGISAFGLSERLKIPRKEAANLIDSYFKLYPKVRAFMDDAIAKAREKGYAETVLGRRRTLRDINSRNASARSAAERDAINTPIQGSAADLIKLAMVKTDAAMKAAGLRAKMVLQIHDELVFDCPREELAALTEIVEREMTRAYDFGVPLVVEIGSGANWLEAH
ncbi:MAG: DNA polymerase I [Kiritimatiellae bacterium]|nr:DNA polymerase I [Kiritimatiellia bacterium]